jgi:CheY-like chemotaxis protein
VASVFVVDDDIDIRTSLCEILEFQGYQVTGLANGQEALDRLREGTRPCVILLDLMMPVLNGWEFRAAQAHDEALADIPVVIISGAGRAAEAATLGAAGFLRKPLELSDILAAVETHCTHGAIH